MTFVNMERIEKRFNNQSVLRDVSLKMNRGEIVSIIGPSGSGKSTFLRCLGQLETIDGGSITVDGTVLASTENGVVKYASPQTQHELLLRMGMVFQYSALFDSMSVGENVAFGLRQHTKLKDDEIKRIVAERLDWVGLKGYESYMPNELSGGMKKRVSLARAIALDPSLILYDEPSSGLDPITSGTISMLIKGMQNRLGCTSIVVTHDMQSAFYVADRIALLDQGHFVEISDTIEFKNSTNKKVQQFIHGEAEPINESAMGDI